VFGMVLISKLSSFWRESITAYDPKTAEMTLNHNSAVIQVDISLLVSTLNVSSGDWVHIFGYFTTTCVIEAIMVLSATGIDIEKYTAAVNRRHV